MITNNPECNSDLGRIIDDVSIPFYKLILNSIIDHIEYNINEGIDALSGLDFLEDDYLGYFAKQAATIAKTEGLIDNNELYNVLMENNPEYEQLKETLETKTESLDDIRNPLRLGKIMFDYWSGKHILGENTGAPTNNANSTIIDNEATKKSIKDNILSSGSIELD